MFGTLNPDPTHPSSYPSTSSFLTSLLNPSLPPSSDRTLTEAGSSWSVLDSSPLPPSRRSHTLTGSPDSNSLIISFGFHSSSPNAFSLLDDVWEWSTETGEYEKIATGGGIETGGHLSCVYNDHLYVIGGLRFQNRQWSSPSQTSLHILSLTSPSLGWTSIPFPSIPSRGELVGGCLNDKMYFHGGLRINGNDVMGMNDLWEIDLNTYVEKKFKDGPGERFSHAGAVCEERFCVSGGRAFKPSGSWYMLSEVSCYYFGEEVWRDETPENRYERVYHSLDFFEDEMYQFGGYRSVVNGNQVVAMVDNDLLKFKGGEWLRYNREDTDVPVRFQHDTEIWKGALVVYGGRFETTEDCRVVNEIGLGGLGDEAWMRAEGDAGEEFDLGSGVHLIVAAMIITGLMLLAVFGAIRRRALDAGEPAIGMFGRSNNAGMEQNQIDEIGITEYRKEPSGAAVLDESEPEEAETCSICLSDFTEGENIRKLPCGHIFHPECVDVWLKRNCSCPACRQSIRTMQRAGEVRERLERERRENGGAGVQSQGSGGGESPGRGLLGAAGPPFGDREDEGLEMSAITSNENENEERV
ncbi:hypothetical protein TrST_g5403 [Triparma strigata]|uniref:RING-type domain-containing protein n=1 Tax=Triparma strigata TaxID=1606541 RepID=A0A9W7AXW0_9STRA|nr:hypothetical protein TrST_g5403 [Triparma strigata]